MREPGHVDHELHCPGHAPLAAAPRPPADGGFPARDFRAATCRYEDVKDELVERGGGDCAVVLTSGHDGAMVFSDLPQRELVFDDSWYNPDTHAHAVLDATRRHLEAQGLRPHVVKLHAARRHIDVNRPPGPRAYECAEMASVHDAYHSAIEACIEAAAAAGTPMLYDYHCQGYMLKAVLRGTFDGASCAPHVAKYGPECVTGAASFCTVLDSLGVDVDPPPLLPLCCVPKELSGFKGGYTTARHGGVLPGTPPARAASTMQLEIGSHLKRTRGEVDDLGKAFAEAMLAAHAAFP